jgi:hypothetical protein
MNTTKASLALGNAYFIDAAKSAMDAVFHLDDMGCVVREIELRGRRPIIRIDPPPVRCWLRGALHKRVTQHGATRTVYVAVCHGAKVEWEVIGPSDAHRRLSWAT